jgi:hypothetical protein
MPISKEEIDTARADERMRKAEKQQAELKAAEKAENEAPRKMISDAYDYAKDKASELVEKAKKGMGMKKGGKVKSASSRADGIAMRGKTRGKMY